MLVGFAFLVQNLQVRVEHSISILFVIHVAVLRSRLTSVEPVNPSCTGDTR